MWQPHTATPHLYWVLKRRLKYSGSSMSPNTCTVTGTSSLIVQIVMSSKKRLWAMIFFLNCFSCFESFWESIWKLGDGEQLSPLCVSLNLCMQEPDFPHIILKVTASCIPHPTFPAFFWQISHAALAVSRQLFIFRLVLFLAILFCMPPPHNQCRQFYKGG